MFIRKDNTLRWKWILTGALVTIGLGVIGVYWFDIPVYLFLRQFDGPVWHLIGNLFGTNIWLFISFCVFLVSVLLRKKYEKLDKTKWTFSFGVFFKGVWNSIVDFKTNLKRFILWLGFHNNQENTGLKKHISDIASKLSFLVLCAVILDSIIVAPLKIIFGRMRPVFLEALGDYGFVPFTTEWAFNSMPSGHAAAGFAGLITIGMFSPKIKWLTWTMAILVGISRICIGVHFPSDVILGAFIGMISADVVKSLVYRIK